MHNKAHVLARRSLEGETIAAVICVSIWVGTWMVPARPTLSGTRLKCWELLKAYKADTNLHVLWWMPSRFQKNIDTPQRRPEYTPQKACHEELRRLSIAP